MSGPRDDDAAEPSEFYIVGGGDQLGSGAAPPDKAGPGPQQREPSAERSRSRRRAALAVGAVLIFGLGIAVGTHVGGATSRAGGGSPSTGAVATGSDAAGSTAATTGRGSSTAGKATDKASSEVSGPTSGGPPGAGEPASGHPSGTARSMAPFPSGPNACGDTIPLALVTGARPAPAGTGLHLIAGADPARIDVDAGRVGDPIPLRHGQFVTDLAAEGKDTVALVRSCTDPGSGEVIRQGPPGTPPVVVAFPAGDTVMSLIGGGDRVWAAVGVGGESGYGSDSRVELVPTDGFGDPVTLPAGFLPRAGWQNLIVGTYQSSADVGGTLIQVYSLTRSGIIDQFGGPNPQFVVGDGFVLWSPSCQRSCQVHRFDLVTGKDSASTRAYTPGDSVGGDFASWLAASPDGARLAMLVPASTGRSGSDTGGGKVPQIAGFRLVVADLDSGTTTPLPGVTVAMPFVSVAFSRGSSWLAVAVAAPHGARVLLYDKHLRGPYRIGAAAVGIGRGFVPLLVTVSA